MVIITNPIKEYILGMDIETEEKRFERCRGRAIIVTPTQYKIFSESGMDMSCVFESQFVPLNSPHT